MVDENQYIEILKKDLNSVDELVVANACKALGQLKVCFDLIEEQCLDSNPKIRSAALVGLSNFDDAVEAVMDNANAALKDENPYVVQAALDIYIKFHEARDLDEVAFLCSNKNPNIRQKAYHAIGAMRDYDHKNLLITGLREKNHTARIGAARGIRWLSDPSILFEIIHIIKNELSKKKVDYLVLQELVRAAVNSDGAGRDESLYMRILEDVPNVRSYAAEAIGKLNITKARNLLEQATRDSSTSLRKAAAEALIKIGPKDSIEYFRELLNDSDHGIIISACRAVAVANDLKSLNKIKEYVFHDSPSIRSNAFRALIELSHDDARPVAKQLLTDNNSEIRELATQFFDDYPQEKGIPHFAPNSNDERTKENKEITIRKGQSDFKSELFNIHGACCMVTGCHVSEVVEAAHIKPYRGVKDNNIQNGLLLRADIHILFDRSLIAIEPASLIIHVSPVLRDSEYFKFDGKVLNTSNPDVISKEALSIAWDKFTKLLLKN